MKYAVYEIETPEGSYIGVTGRSPKLRAAELRCQRGIDGKIRVLATYDWRADAYAHEKRLRPNLHMGLNRSSGGFEGGPWPRWGSANPAAKRVKIQGIEYLSMQEAATALGMKKTAVHYRLNSPYFKDWSYIASPNGRYWESFFKGRKRVPAVSAALQQKEYVS